MAFQQTGLWLNVWRLIAGVGFGVQLVTVDAYIAELVPRTLRGRAFAVNQFISFCVVPLVALLAWLLVPLQPWGFDGWRWVVLLGSVGALFVWRLRAGIPESPRWLMIHGRNAEAEKIVEEVETKVSAHALVPHDAPPTRVRTRTHTPWRQIWNTILHEHRRATAGLLQHQKHRLVAVDNAAIRMAHPSGRFTRG